MAHTVVVHGASGHLGRHIVDQLLERGQPKDKIVTPIRKLDSDAGKELARLGVKVVQGDYLDKASLEKAYVGAHSVIVVPTATGTLERITAQENAYAAAKTAKVTRVIAVSFGNGKVDSLNLLQPAYLHIESAARTSGLQWLVIRMGLYVENQEASFKHAVETGILSATAKGTDRAPYITRLDIARGIAAAVLQWELHGRTFDFEGQAAVSFDELAALVSKASGKKVVFKSLTVDEVAKNLTHLGAFAGYVAALYASLAAAAAAGEFSVNNDLYEVTGHIAEPIENYFNKLLKK